MAITPPRKPQATREQIEGLISGLDKRLVHLVGVRGYYRDSMGKKGVNDRSVYDDSIFLIGPDVFVSFNANVDPSIYRHRVAVLKEGFWSYKLGIHGLSKPKSQQYQALVQAAPVTVVRDGVGNDTGWFGINIHRGGYNTTSSLGCQTLPPAQWPSFIELVKSQMKIHGQKTIIYLLTSKVV